MKFDYLPTLAVVVPAYNEAGQLEQCLDNLIAQSGDLAEIIIVDNNSTDATLDLAKSYAAVHEIVRVLQEKRQGLVPARNRGFLAVKSEVVARIDADTLVQPGWAHAIRKYFAANPAKVALDGQTHYYDLPFDNFTASASSFFVRGSNRLVAGFPSLYGPNMALRADVAKMLAAEACYGKVNEDLDLTIHLLAGGYDIGHEKAMLAYISGRRVKSSPTKFLSYLLNWPRTYLRHGSYVSAAGAFLFSLCFFVLQMSVVAILRAYDPVKYEFSWRRAMASTEDRIIP